MKFRLGMVIGFALGYYLGAMAGRQRYEQINRLLRRLRRSERFEMATEKARAVVDRGVERARGSDEPAEPGPIRRPGIGTDLGPPSVDTVMPGDY